MATAIDDLVRNRDATDPSAQTTYLRARAWFLSRDRSWPFSFLNLCDMLNLPADRIRRHALARTRPVSLFDDSLPS